MNLPKFIKLFPIRNQTISTLWPIKIKLPGKFSRLFALYEGRRCKEEKLEAFRNIHRIAASQSIAKNIFERKISIVPFKMKKKTVGGSKPKGKGKNCDSKNRTKNKESKISNFCKSIMRTSKKETSSIGKNCGSKNQSKTKIINQEITGSGDCQKKSGNNLKEKQKILPCKKKDGASENTNKITKSLAFDCEVEKAKPSTENKEKCDNSETKIKKPEEELKESQVQENCPKKQLQMDKSDKKNNICENPCKGKENLVAKLYKQYDIRIEESEKPKPCQGEVLIAMNCVTLCSDDLNYYTKEGLLSPIILGRDGTGVIAELGQGVRNFREGDRVVIEPNVHCSQCEFCKSCQYHLCCHSKTCGLIPHDGLLTCYFKHAADYCHKIPDSLTMEEGVLIHMLANGINVCSRCPMCVGQSLLVIGAGPVGWASLIAAKAMGATNTCVMCKFENRLELAKLYDTETVQICDDASPEDMAQTVREKLGSAPVITIDSVGSETSMKLATACTSSGGTIVLAGVTGDDHKIPLADVAHRDISIRSALRHSKKFPAAIALANRSDINLKALISHHFFLEEIAKAFETLMENQDTVNKVIVHIRPRDRNNKNPF